ncbi:MAG: type II toxin-antitoxin system RelE/ParE family toxin [Bacteroidaceae bacterium]|nr:type II toxin-antitoxin system RelE/ParE family toxin [Bacteroidaceae bacterium]
MALEILYSQQFADNMESILRYFDERNGSDAYTRKLMGMIHSQIQTLTIFPEIGRMTDFPGVRILFVERYGIEYQIREDMILVVDIFSCLTNPDERLFKKQ